MFKIRSMPSQLLQFSNWYGSFLKRSGISEHCWHPGFGLVPVTALAGPESTAPTRGCRHEYNALPTASADFTSMLPIIVTIPLRPLAHANRKTEYLSGAACNIVLQGRAAHTYSLLHIESASSRYSSFNKPVAGTEKTRIRCMGSSRDTGARRRLYIPLQHQCLWPG